MLILCVGAFFAFSGSVGILRLPDFFTRLHPAGMSDGTGLMLVVLGACLLLEPGLITLKLVLLGVFALLTGATACHALARAAALSNLKPLGKIEAYPVATVEPAKPSMAKAKTSSAKKSTTMKRKTTAKKKPTTTRKKPGEKA
ncbi:MAG: monovalent cation/H(+) antiporter subunit G [Hyphomicrobiales bacterium]|nr:monovalent cation/H(+) antiporter subunit G [Hyphomicrobiales bacterium]